MIVEVPALAWNLRPAGDEDREILFELHRAAMRPSVEETWGWDEQEQTRMFAERFVANSWQVIQVGDEMAGMLSVREAEAEIWLRSIAIDPRFQGRGLGTVRGASGARLRGTRRLGASA